MPSLNPPRKFFAKAIESVAQQFGHVKAELIILESGRLSRTESLVDAALRFQSKRLELKIVETTGAGQWDAVARGLSEARYEWKTILSTDDVLKPWAFEALELLPQDVNWIISNRSVIDEKGATLYQPSHFVSGLVFSRSTIALGEARKPEREWIQQEGTFFRGMDLGPFISELKQWSAAGDFFLWTVLAKELIPVYHRHPLGSFRIRRGQKSEDMTFYLAEIESRFSKNAESLEKPKKSPDEFRLISSSRFGTLSCLP